VTFLCSLWGYNVMSSPWFLIYNWLSILQPTNLKNICAGTCQAEFVVGGQTTQTTEGIQDFTYLGSQISSTVGTRMEQQRKIGIASGTMQSPSYIGSATYFAVDKAPAANHPGSAGSVIRFRNVDCHKTGPFSSAGISYEVPKADSGCMLAGSCH